MTHEEIRRFALQLSEAERICALIAQDAASMDGNPSTRAVRAVRERVLQGPARFERERGPRLGRNKGKSSLGAADDD